VIREHAGIQVHSSWLHRLRAPLESTAKGIHGFNDVHLVGGRQGDEVLQPCTGPVHRDALRSLAVNRVAKKSKDRECSLIRRPAADHIGQAFVPGPNIADPLVVLPRRFLLRQHFPRTHPED
jgi:hypothetical protein